jgi:hypothetical protein
MSQEYISIAREMGEFLNLTDRAGLKSDMIGLPEGFDGDKSHTVEFGDSYIS